MKIEYLGYTVSVEAVQMEKSKVKATVQQPILVNLKQLRGFMSLSGYYRRFIAKYASIAHPLTELLKKDTFKWTETAKAAFQELKNRMISTPVLKLLDFGQPFVLVTDASRLGIVAVMSQNKHPIAFFSRKLTSSMQKQFAYVRELFVVTKAVNKFRHYRVGHQFVIRTGQEALKHSCQQTI